MDVHKFAIYVLSKFWNRIVEEASRSDTLSSAVQQILHPDPIFLRPLERLTATQIQAQESGKPIELLPLIPYPASLLSLEELQKQLLFLLSDLTGELTQWLRMQVTLSAIFIIPPFFLSVKRLIYLFPYPISIFPIDRPDNSPSQISPQWPFRCMPDSFFHLPQSKRYGNHNSNRFTY